MNNSIWTKRRQPWVMAGLFGFPTKKDALIAEKFIKKQKSAKTILKILNEGFRSNGLIMSNKMKWKAGYNASDPGLTGKVLGSSPREGA
jgi:hypothetical protein